MRTAIFDIETDGLLPDVTRLHVGVVLAVDEEYSKSIHDPRQMVDELDRFDIIVGHNAIQYDIPALQRLVPGWIPKARVVDTLVLSRLVYPDRTQHPAGGNSLKHWGDYFKCPKGDVKDFSKYTFEMLEYCAQDVAITSRLWNRLSPAMATEAARIEHEVAAIVSRQQANGFGFDLPAAQALNAQLQCRSIELTEELQKAFPAKEIPLKTKVKVIPFNPGSRDQIAMALIKKYKWKPKQFTETGKPQIDESILEDLDYPETRLLEEYLLVEKRLSQIAQWLDACRDMKIHGGVNTNGAVSGRMTHSDPNLAQVPRCGSLYGKECRSLFRPTRQGWVQVGADASGLELRMFAHYLAAYDGGAYGSIVCDGDIHTHNQKAAGLATRDQAKTFIYGMLYGAGDAKVGKIVNGTQADGARLKASFKRQVPAYAKLLQAIEYKVQSRNMLIGLDSRALPVRSAHSAMNLLLQSAGAVIMKKALCILEDSLIPHRGAYAFMANIHDEWQIECDPEFAEAIGMKAIDSIRQAGEFFKLKCPLKGEFKIGNNWAETH